MNREIEFRGKRVDNGEWEYGSLVVHKDILWEDQKYYYIETDTGEDRFEILPETIGQYTGLKNKDGKKLFEGDIVKYKHKTWFKRKKENIYDYKIEKCYIIWEQEFCDYILNKYPNKITRTSCIDLLMIDNDGTIEVIGTIFDKEV